MSGKSCCCVMSLCVLCKLKSLWHCYQKATVVFICVFAQAVERHHSKLWITCALFGHNRLPIRSKCKLRTVILWSHWAAQKLWYPLDRCGMAAISLHVCMHVYIHTGNTVKPETVLIKFLLWRSQLIVNLPLMIADCDKHQPISMIITGRLVVFGVDLIAAVYQWVYLQPGFISTTISCHLRKN